MDCGSAFEPGASRLPYYCTPPVCVPDVIGALAVVWQNTKKQKEDNTDDGEEASLPSSPTAALGSQRCVACLVLIPLDRPLRSQHCRPSWPATEGAASTSGKTKISLLTGGEQANIVRGDDLKVRPTEWICNERALRPE